MKKTPILLLLIVVSGLLFAAPALDIVESAGTVQVSCSYQQEESVNRFAQQTFAIPAQSVSVEIQSMRIGLYNAEGERVNQYEQIQPERVAVAKQFTLREMRGFTVRIETSRDENGLESRIDDLEYSLISNGTFTYPQNVSEAYVPIYKQMAANYETSYLRHMSYQRPSMLIISHSTITPSIQNFVTWKRSLGFEVTIEDIENISTNANDIRAWIADFYNNAENRPEYLIVIGDVVGSLSCPTFYTSLDNNVTDLPYTLIEGDDFLPEMIVGRVSINVLDHALSIFSKTIKYERTPYMADTAWFNRALVVAGNYGQPIVPVTPVLMSKWLRDQFVNHGYTTVDTLFYPPVSNGAPYITPILNAGAQFVSYRGWGAENGWHYPRYHSDDLASVTSGEKMHVVSSVVCGTGDFGDTVDGNACFGEQWMRMGSASAPNGAVAFFGPSYLHTSTEPNNAVSSGFYQGVLEEGIHSFGTAVLRGKTELYNNYPNDNEQGGVTEFYYHIYNILSDPSLKMWKQVPDTPTAVLPAQIEKGTNYLSLDLSGWNGGIVTASRDMVNFSFARVDAGHAFLNIDTSETGNLLVTISRENAVPVYQSIPIVASDNVGIVEHTLSNVYSGMTAGLSITVQNFNDAAVSDLTATLTSDSPYFISTDDVWNFGSIAAGGTATANGTFDISVECPFHEFIELTAEFSNGDVSKLVAVAGALLFEVTACTPTGDGFLSPGETTDITIQLTNISSYDAVGVTANVVSSTDAVTVNSAEITFGDIASGSTGTATLNVEAGSNAFLGRSVRFLLNIEDEDGRETYNYAYTEIGPVDQSAPTGPDAYGYYAYDNNDTGYDVPAPVYEWHTIDPNEGGNGTVFLWTDDASETVDLPFTFRFYGQDFDEVTICSNGWLSMGRTWMANFRNWNIPAALGPANLIAPYWDDLKGLVVDDERTVNDMRIVYYYDEGANEFIVQWNDAYNQENNTSIEKFEVVLIPRVDHDGDIVFNYQTVDNPDIDSNYSTVGIESNHHDSGVCYSYANIYPATASTLANGLAIKFTTDAPDEYTSVDDGTVAYSDVVLQQNYPNPFNPVTTIEFALPNEMDVALEVYNVRGQKVKTLVAQYMESGKHEVTWFGKDDNNRDVSSGLYFYKLTTGDKVNVRKMLLLK